MTPRDDDSLWSLAELGLVEAIALALVACLLLGACCGGRCSVRVDSRPSAETTPR